MTGAASERRLPAAWKIGVLSVLYFAQGLPFGFQANALSLYLLELGISKTEIGLVGALALPWSLKVFWAPLVDRYGNERFGRRKSWIVPAQAVLALTCVGAAFFPLDAANVVPFLVLVLLMNVFAATQDIAVDGLAVDLLAHNELGAGNAAQVVGYKLGMIVGGSLLVALGVRVLGSERKTDGISFVFFSMAALCLLAMTVVLFVKEPKRTVEEHLAAASAPQLELLPRLLELVKRPGAGWLLLAAATYKGGETLADSMFGLWLKEVHHLPIETIALWLGGWGIVASIAGSFVGGLIATRVALKRAVFLAAIFRVLPLAAQWALTLGFGTPNEQTIIPLTCAEHFFGGILTTTMFALMMSAVDRSMGATHFTLLASVEVVGKSIPRLSSGFLVDQLGYQPVFAVVVVLSALFLLVVPRVPEPPRVAART